MMKTHFKIKRLYGADCFSKNTPKLIFWHSVLMEEVYSLWYLVFFQNLRVLGLLNFRNNVEAQLGFAPVNKFGSATH